MSIFEAIILGIIQGLTEFLPVSSSGHLELAKVILGDNSLPEESMLMTVVLHGATALSTIIVFRKDIVEIVKGLFQFKNNEEFKFSLNIVLSMIPAAFVGVVFNDEIEAFFGGKILLVGSMLILTAILLIFADKAKNTNKKVGILQAIIIGVSQAIAILPGISRSGATISASVLLGIDRERAARFSFLMVVPLILGKMAKDILDGAFDTISGSMLNYGVGFIAAFITGILACTWMIKLVKKSKLKYFAFYCFIVGAIAIVYSLV
ncbi:MAG: undecaprenyl-diphosphate phosphatase [Flavobacteriales bacterium]|nr:undecaprenyl-diphosphate phosphatase [Flavobacteriales bacterium]MCB9363726.1 undecaprenyl-diphosphate phosphatase [Flavobacteriales bacterium]